MEEKDTIVTLIDEENGQPVDFDLLLTFSYEGKRYAALQPLDEVAGIEDDEIVLLEIVKENARKTRFFDASHFLVSDYRNYLRKAKGKERFDVVFIDPPYAERIAVDAMERVIAADMAKHGTLFVLESEEDLFADAPPDGSRFELLKAKKYGRTYVHILRYLTEDAE